MKRRLGLSNLVLDLLVTPGLRVTVLSQVIKFKLRFHHVLNTHLEVGSLGLDVDFTTVDDYPTNDVVPDVGLNLIVMKFLS